MKTLEITHAEARDLIDAPRTFELAQGKWRWGHSTTFGFQHTNGLHYGFTLRFHAEEGLQDEGSVTCRQIEPHQITETVWRFVPLSQVESRP